MHTWVLEEESQKTANGGDKPCQTDQDAGKRCPKTRLVGVVVIAHCLIPLLRWRNFHAGILSREVREWYRTGATNHYQRHGPGTVRLLWDLYKG
jgi:hypothetical protein